MFTFLFAALSAIAATRVQKPRVPGAEKFTITDIAFDNSYAEGGEKVTPEDLGLSRVTHSTCELVRGTESEENVASSAHYDEETELLHLRDSKTGKEFTKEKDASKVIVRVLAWGS